MSIRLQSFLFIACALLPAAAQAQYINIRVSVKFILSPSGLRPTGLWTNMDHWRAAIDVANAGNARHGRGFRYSYPTFDGDVSGYGQYYNLEKGEELPFEYSIRTNASQTHWRADALNVYIVNNNLGTAAKPSCAGWASNPQDPLADYSPYNALRGRIVVFCVNMEAGPFGIMAHEFGHHQSLIHTWGDDRVDDTPVDADPALCEQDGVPDWCSCKFSQSRSAGLAQGWSAELFYLMTNNIMSYHCDNDLDFELTEGQLDRWADMTRMYLASECTGVTYFVQRGSAASSPDGYSRNYFPGGGPFLTVSNGVAAANGLGGDILILRPANYNERMTISKGVTLRVTRAGSASIGRP